MQWIFTRCGSDPFVQVEDKKHISVVSGLSDAALKRCWSPPPKSGSNGSREFPMFEVFAVYCHVFQVGESIEILGDNMTGPDYESLSHSGFCFGAIVKHLRVWFGVWIWQHLSAFEFVGSKTEAFDILPFRCVLKCLAAQLWIMISHWHGPGTY